MAANAQHVTGNTFKAVTFLWISAQMRAHKNLNNGISPQTLWKYLNCNQCKKIKK